MSTPFRAECFGKLPLHGDFIRHRAGPELQEVDRWVQAGLLAVRGRSDWEQAWPATPPLRFLRRYAASSRLLAGVIAPSRDSAGRDYPFLVAAVIEGKEVRRQPELAPLLCQPFFAAAEDVALRSWDGAGYRDVQAAVDRIAGDLDGKAAERRLGALLAETTFEQFVVDQLGDWDDRRFLLLANAASLLGPRSRPRFALRLPGGGEAAGATACWLALVTALRGGAAGFGTLTTWSTGPGGKESGLRLVLGDPAGDQFLPLVMSHLPSDACDLAKEGLDSPGLMQKARDRFGPLADPRARLSELAPKLAAAARAS